ncbi:hypothetical protein [Pelagimonas varians]|uniref:Uncharacterized protein n=1 Tax=Pelagimonas varians TaxID=696760 RepID=A0A238K6R6_9RHOB|nr:hypothetical protein [Pelagimonas varians]PYG31777.1 hypothetical protein C8N36_104197 [Pelagimonas varians]SMX38600.1 hypothetical protein PEV8663_01447 [Pelagimonas varians]
MPGTRVEALSRLKIQGRIQRDLFQVAEDRMVLQQARYWSRSCSSGARPHDMHYSPSRSRLYVAEMIRALIQAAVVMITAAVSFLLVFGLVG